MAVVHSPESNFSKEMAKWESGFTQYGEPGRPYTYQPFPTRMYKAYRAKDGSRQFEAATANDEHEQRNLESRDFVVGGQQAALDALEGRELEIAKLAAEGAYEERRMSEKAQAEATAVRRASAVHLGEIPEAPKRGRKPKGEPVSA
jgi:hypothetical protein